MMKESDPNLYNEVLFAAENPDRAASNKTANDERKWGQILPLASLQRYLMKNNPDSLSASAVF